MASTALATPRLNDRLPFGFLAYLGVAVSMIVCYFDFFVGLLSDAVAAGTLTLNPHVQAVLMWSFGLVAIFGLSVDRKAHGLVLPLLLGILGLGIVIGTLYVYYEATILMTGYMILLVGAFLNQNAMLRYLNHTVGTQRAELAELNTTLERRVAEQVQEIERLARLKRFLGPELAELITSEGREALLESHRRYIACLFCDIRDFTPLSERLEPEEAMNLLQAFHERVGRLVIEHRGTIGYRAGDGVMVFLNDPLPCDAPVLKTLQLATDIKRSFADIRQGWQKLGYDLDIGIGVAAGYATLGMIGTEGRVDYTAIGPVVNIAARLCDLSDQGRILLNQRAYLDVEDAVQTEALGPLELKGVERPTEIHRLVDA